MKLLTKPIERALPPLYSQDGKGGDAIVHLKLFTAWGRGTWYFTEANAILADGTEVPMTDPRAADRSDVMLFGYCLSNLGEDCDEYGYSLLSEFERLPVIERDRHFAPTQLGELVPKLDKQRAGAA